MHYRLIFVAACSFSICQPLFAQEDSQQDEAQKERLAAMRQIAERFAVQIEQDGQPRKVPLMEAPILRFNDPAREFHDATLWAWGEKGRPICLLAIEQYRDQWFECISLFDGKLSADADTLKWRPKGPGITLSPFPEAPPPAKTAPRRTAQMKELLGKLSVHQIGNTGSRYELRLMPRPLHRYQDAGAELQDGAIFAFAFGTNPELLSVIEARGTADKPAWQIGFARCGTAEPHVLLDKMEIFTLPYARGTTPADAYWNFAYRFGK